jgi:DNA-directed RNA polymerase specialized sigma24 family protein
MVSQGSRADSFTEFARSYERQLRQSLTAAWGDEVGRDASAEALEYGWVHWNRVRLMDNPVGYLYKVGRGRGRRMLRRKRPAFEPVDPGRLPAIEPGLPEALASLSERQRTVVILIHCDDWSQSEVAELLGLSRSAVRNHLERGMASLRRNLGVRSEHT